MNFLRSMGWALCCIYATIPCYWLLVHPFAERWRRRQGSRFRILLPAWVGMWGIAWAITSPWRKVLLYDAPWTWVAGAILIAAGILLYRAAGKGFTAAQLGGLPEVQGGGHEQRLAMRGVRAYVRHPIYLGHLCEMLGWSIGTGLAVPFGLTTFAIATGTLMIRQEEGELERRFGNAYRLYRQRVPAIIPSLRRGENAPDHLP